MEKIKKFLAVFYNAACVFSDTKYPTANLYFSSISIVYVTLWEQSESEDVRKMAVQMLVKFEKYWSECNVVLAIAVILDPRYKLQFVDFCYRKIYGVSDSLEYLKVREKLFSLFGEYVSNAPATSSTSFGRIHDKTNQETEFTPSSEQMMILMKVWHSFYIVNYIIICYIYLVWGDTYCVVFM